MGAKQWKVSSSDVVKMSYSWSQFQQMAEVSFTPKWSHHNKTVVAFTSVASTQVSQLWLVSAQVSQEHLVVSNTSTSLSSCIVCRQQAANPHWSPAGSQLYMIRWHLTLNWTSSSEKEENRSPYYSSLKGRHHLDNSDQSRTPSPAAEQRVTCQPITARCRQGIPGNRLLVVGTRYTTFTYIIFLTRNKRPFAGNFNWPLAMVTPNWASLWLPQVISDQFTFSCAS